MNDFLHHLASRAVSPVPLIRPLVRTPYEPPAPGEFSFTAVTNPLSRESPPPFPAPLPIQRQREVEPTTTRDTPSPPAPEFPPPFVFRKIPPSTAPLPVKVAAAAEPLAKRLPASPLTTPALEAATFRPPVTRPLMSPVISETEVIVPKTAAPAETLADSQTSRSHSHPPDVPQAVAKIPGVPSPADPLIRPRLDPLPRISSQRSPARTETPATLQPAPQVTITIGRVEIRAAAPAAQPSPPPAVSGPPLSLETYLRRSATRSA